MSCVRRRQPRNSPLRRIEPPAGRSDPRSDGPNLRSDGWRVARSVFILARMFEIQVDDLSSESTLALLALHLRGMRAESPADSVYALDVSGLTAPGVTVWSARSGDEVVGLCALKELGDGAAELKSMRTHPDHLRRGVACALLDHIVAEARRRGLRRLSLETGTGHAFEPALTLYRRHDFVDGEPFGDYRPSGFNRFLHLTL